MNRIASNDEADAPIGPAAPFAVAVRDVFAEFGEYIMAGAKPRSQWRGGAELELFGFTAGTQQRLDYHQIQSVLSALAPDPADRAFDGDILVGARQRGGGNLSVEPGGQLEYSSAPHGGLAEVESELRAYQWRLRAVAEANRFQFLGIGFDPLRTIDEQHWFPKPRYDIMRPYMATRGARAWDMMCRTNAVQVSLDFENVEDLARKFIVGNRLAPYVAAMFANSPFADGKPSGFKSTRALTWLETDPDRCGIPELAWQRDFDLPDLVEYAMVVPMLFRRRKGNYLSDVTGVPFRAYLNSAMCDDEFIASDWADHLTTVFTEARVKQVIELRTCDGGSIEMAMAAQALWKGLLYDPEALAAAEGLIPDLTVREVRELQFVVARDGLQAQFNGAAIFPEIVYLLVLARQGLQRIAPDEVHYLDILRQQVIDEQVSPADILLHNWHGSWHGSMDRLFEYVRIA